MVTNISNDEMITKAILDRIITLLIFIYITGQSYRIKDKIKPLQTEDS